MTDTRGNPEAIMTATHSNQGHAIHVEGRARAEIKEGHAIYGRRRAGAKNKEGHPIYGRRHARADNATI